MLENDPRNQTDQHARKTVSKSALTAKNMPSKQHASINEEEDDDRPYNSGKVASRSINSGAAGHMNRQEFPVATVYGRDHDEAMSPDGRVAYRTEPHSSLNTRPTSQLVSNFNGQLYTGTR